MLICLLDVTNFFDAYKNKIHKMYLIVDAYDHFTNEILLRDLSEFKKVFRKIYETIKEAIQRGIVQIPKVGYAYLIPIF